MILGFDFTSGYAALIYVLGGLLVIVAALEKIYGWLRSLKAKLRPEPVALPPPARSPVIVLGAPTYSYSVMTVPERRLEPKRYLTRLGVEYIIENKEATVTVTEVVTGVRRKNDGREEQFDAFKAPALAPLEKAPVRGFQLPWRSSTDLRKTTTRSRSSFGCASPRTSDAGGRLRPQEAQP